MADTSKKKLLEKYCYDGSRHFSIKDASTDETSLCKDKAEALEQMQKNDAKMDELQAKLYAAKKEGVIFLFQAMDAAGKDGTIRSVLTCLSPHGVHEAAFKAPSSEDLAHDFLWRVEQQVPAKGEIAIFNRSHYEDVLIGKVKELYRQQAHADRIDEDTIIEDRYKDIRHYEQYLYHNSIRTVKIFLHVSKDEQALRFLSRIEEPEKNWKFSPSDWQERGYWDAYQKAFEDAINATAAKEAPWYVVPADHKWYMRYIVSEILCDTLKDMNPQYPEVTKERLGEFDKLRGSIERELPKDKLEKFRSRENKESGEEKAGKDKKGKKEKKDKD